MALSGVTAAIVDTIAQSLGAPAKDLARNMGPYAYNVPTATLTDSTGKVGSLAWTNLQGQATIYWGDGTTTVCPASSGSPKTHTYAAAGSKTVHIVALAAHKSSTVTVTA